MGDVSEEKVLDDFVIKVPGEWLVRIVSCGGVEALQALRKPWAVVIKEAEADLVCVKGFDTQGECSDLVADLHGTDAQVVFVLKRGIPRKNIRIEVRARFR